VQLQQLNEEIENKEKLLKELEAKTWVLIQLKSNNIYKNITHHITI
jgi:hypothetical protein